MGSRICAGMAEGGVVRAPPSPSKVRNPTNTPKIEKTRSSNVSALIRKFIIKHTVEAPEKGVSWKGGMSEAGAAGYLKESCASICLSKLESCITLINIKTS